MRSYFLGSLGLLVTLGIASDGQAQIYECNGTWTNRSCDGSSSSTLKEKKVSEEDSAAAKVRRDKQSALHELTMKSLEANRKFNLRFSVDSVSNFCEHASTSVQQCRDAVDTEHDRLDEKLAQAALVKERRRENDLREEEQRTDRNQTTVIIEDRPEIWVIPRDPHRPHHHGDYHHHGQYGGSVQVQGSQGSVSINGGAGFSAGGTVSTIRNDPPFRGYQNPARRR